ncbi:hypothetical protein RUM43_004187 [Polyplax serrata]|uniref:Major facilitator superfamily domain-containing protein 12-like n=1 Tax=Polyplax serrata TaxID=468196 RepID=A0AAN8XLI2_POLSC
MFVKRSPARDSSEDSVLLLPRKSSGTMAENKVTKESLKLSQRIAYGLGHVMNDICSAMWFSYTLLFFEVVLQMPSSVAGALIFTGQVVDAVFSPIIGLLVDRYGSRKSWHMLGTAMLVLTYPLTFANCPWNPGFTIRFSKLDGPLGSWKNFDETQLALAATYFALLVTVFQVGWAMVQISHLAIIPDITPDKNERANLTAIRYTANVGAYVFVFLITWFILHVTHGSHASIGSEDAYKFKAVALLGLSVGGVCTVIFHIVLKTPDALKPIAKSQSTKKFSTWITVIGEYFKAPLLYQVTLVYFASRMLLTISLVYMPLYLVESVGKEEEFIATVPLVSYIGSLVASLLMRQFRTLFHTKTYYIMGTILSIVASVWIGVGFKHNEELFGLATLLGAGSSITGVASLCLCADLVGTDTENGAFVYSVVTAMDKLLGGVVVIIIEYTKTEISTSKAYYQNVLAYGCGVSSILGLVALTTMYLNTKPSSTSLTRSPDSNTH